MPPKAKATKTQTMIRGRRDDAAGRDMAPADDENRRGTDGDPMVGSVCGR